MEEFPPEAEWGISTKLVRVPNALAAQFVIAASQEEYLEDDPIDVLKTEQEHLLDLWQCIRDRYWFMRPEFQAKIPFEQWNIHIGHNTVPLYNYSSEVQLEAAAIERIAVNIARFGSLFTHFAPHLEAITIIDKPYNNPLEDDMGESFPDARMFYLTPYALQDGPYRPDMPVPRLDAVVVHELAHFGMDEALEPKWEAAGYHWQPNIGYSEKLQYIANRPEECVTTYAERGGVYEDIAESIVAYMLNGAKLAPPKAELLDPYEQWLSMPVTSAEKLSTIHVPELPKEITYYVDPEEVDRHHW